MVFATKNVSTNKIICLLKLKKDYKKRNKHTKENFKFFGAPNTMFFHLHKNAEAGNFITFIMKQIFSNTFKTIKNTIRWVLF